jgi:hypothetical protein
MKHLLAIMITYMGVGTLLFGILTRVFPSSAWFSLCLDVTFALFVISALTFAALRCLHLLKSEVEK